MLNLHLKHDSHQLSDWGAGVGGVHLSQVCGGNCCRASFAPASRELPSNSDDLLRGPAATTSYTGLLLQVGGPRGVEEGEATQRQFGAQPRWGLRARQANA